MDTRATLSWAKKLKKKKRYRQRQDMQIILLIPLKEHIKKDNNQFAT